MCYSCYKEYGEPLIVTPQTWHLADLIEKVYNEHDGGGFAHAILDDWNLDDWVIGVTLADCDDHESIWAGEPDVDAMREATRKCLKYMRDLSLEERASALAMVHYPDIAKAAGRRTSLHAD